MAYDYDLFVIGGGSGGVRAARIAASSGAKVALAEEYRMGGTCVIRGCVPKKFMVYASKYGKSIRSAKGYGWTAENVSYDHTRFQAAMAAEVTRLSGLYMSGQKNAGVTVFEERAEFVDRNTLKLQSSGKQITAEKILIAVGGTPWRPDSDELPGVEHTITSDQVFDLTDLPEHIVISGGGYIAVEFAHIFAGLGAKTTLVYRKDKVLRGFDEDVRDVVMEDLETAGVNLITNTTLTEIKKGGSLKYEVALSSGSALDADVILMAVGRRAKTAGLGCEAAGIALAPNGSIEVDEYSRTNVDNIWAVGDVTDRLQLTPVAIREGHAFADTEFFDNPRTFDHESVPTAIFTQPEVGTVGISESDARAKYGDVDIYKTRFKPMKQALSGEPQRVMMKLIVRPSDQVIVGCHMVGDDAAEIIQMAGIAIKMGATKADFDNTCALHPSVSEEFVTLRTKWEPQ